MSELWTGIPNLAHTTIVGRDGKRIQWGRTERKEKNFVKGKEGK